jgi:uncharacterized protein (DUF952 family)
MLIFKIFRPEEFAALERDGETRGAPVDLADGFIHFSTAAQAPETAARHFAGEDDLVLAAVDVMSVADGLKWEESRGGDLFPHLYRPLRAPEIAWVAPLELGADGTHAFPDLAG